MLDGKIRNVLSEYVRSLEDRGDEIELELDVKRHHRLSISVSLGEDGREVRVRGEQHGKPLVLKDGEDGVAVVVGDELVGTIPGYRIARVERFLDDGYPTVVLGKREEREGGKGFFVMFPNAEVYERVYSQVDEETRQVLEEGMKEGRVKIYSGRQS